MSDSAKNDVTELLEAWSEGAPDALERLMPLVYDELHLLAGRYLNDQVPGHTLQTTALIHEAYLKLAEGRGKHWENRAHFFAVAARAMRHIMVDYARARQTKKRGGAAHRVALDESALVSAAETAEVLALNEALENLFARDERKGRVVELRYFGGLSVEETAAVLKISPDTVTRDWRFAKSWLLRELSAG